MAAFSHHQHPPFEVDSVLFPNSSLKNFGIFDELFISNFSEQGFSLVSSAYESSCIEQQSIKIEPSGAVKQSTVQSSISLADNKDENMKKLTQNLNPLDKKRKSKSGSSSVSANSKDTKLVKCKKQKVEKESKKEVKNEKQNQNQANEELPKGYIHVRARRGQATDSHSLAERVRREKISERMKMLQALVPGCDKVTGKALMLDEIIYYVQSLQNQVEFLSLKLASLDPMVHTFGLMDIDPLAFGTEGMNNNMALPMVQQMPCTTVSATSSGTAQPLTLADTTATTTLPYPLVDSSTSLLPMEQKPNVLPLQDGRSSNWGVLDDQQQRQSFINQFYFSSNNLCSFTNS